VGSSVPPKMFSNPSLAGQSQQNNLVQEAQAAPQIQGPQFSPLPTTETPATPPDMQPIDPQQQYQQEVIKRFRQVGSPLNPKGSFYGENAY
jgi:hypothetical protein